MIGIALQVTLLLIVAYIGVKLFGRILALIAWMTS